MNDINIGYKLQYLQRRISGTYMRDKSEMRKPEKIKRQKYFTSWRAWLLWAIAVNAERIAGSEAYEKGIVSEEGQAWLHSLVESYRKCCRVNVFGYLLCLQASRSCLSLSRFSMIYHALRIVFMCLHGLHVHLTALCKALAGTLRPSRAQGQVRWWTVRQDPGVHSSSGALGFWHTVTENNRKHVKSCKQ